MYLVYNIFPRAIMSLIIVHAEYINAEYLCSFFINFQLRCLYILTYKTGEILAALDIMI